MKRKAPNIRAFPSLFRQYQQSYVDFVELAERKEAETGRAVTIVVS